MKRVLLFALLSSSTSLHAQEVAPKILNSRWAATWIEVPHTSPHDYGVYHFRKSINLADKPGSFVIHVSADNRYKLFVNGKLASIGPARGDVYNWNYETVDIAPFLQTGRNVLAAVVWNFGDARQEAQISYQTAFILQGNSDQENQANTSASWVCTRDSAYQPLQPELVYSYYAAGPTERINFNHYPLNWADPGFDDKDWLPAHELFNGLPKGVFHWTLGWMLVPRSIPPMELKAQRFQKIRLQANANASGLLQSPATLQVEPHTRASVLLDQGFLTTAFPLLEFSKGKDALISLSYAEGLYVDEGDKTNWRGQQQKGNRDETTGKRFVGTRDELISSGREKQQFSPLAWRTFRYLKLDIETKDEAIVVNDFYTLFEGYPFVYNASFKCDDESMDKILETGWRTARLCAHETYMDCPYYEQLQYVGDTRIQALVSLYNSGDDRLMRNAIEQIRQSLMAEGITMSRYPTAHSQQIPTFSLIWISMLHDYWTYRGDSEFIRRQLPVARMVLDFFHRHQQKDGSLVNVPYWNFTDWVEDKGWNAGVAPIGKDGTSALLDLQLLMAYEAATLLEKTVGMPAYADDYSRAVRLLKQEIRENYWNSHRGLFGDRKEMDTWSQHCNSLAILTGVVTGEAATDLANKMIADTGISKASVYFRYYLHRAMEKAGLGDRYLDMLGKWRENLAMGMTTWAEMDDINRSRSDCHAWGSSPNIELFRIVLGIDSDAPGFGKVRIEPHPGKLKQLSGSMPHPRGKINVSYQLDTKDRWHFKVALPPSTPGEFHWKGKKYPLRPGENEIIL
jgi:hypothetical protein